MKYSGTVTTTGTSEAIRLEKGFFKQNPEFKQQTKVEARVLGPGQMLISVVDPRSAGDEDPIVDGFLSFLTKDIQTHPEDVSELPEKAIKKALKLTKDVAVLDNDDIDADVTI